MAEEIIEFNGAGFIPGVPGEYANCQVVFDSDTKEVLRVEPLGTLATGGLITSTTRALPGEPYAHDQCVPHTSPNISKATADPDGVFRWCSTKVYGSINASGITASSIVTSLASATLVIYGFVAAKWLVPSEFHAVEELPEFSPPDFRGIL